MEVISDINKGLTDMNPVPLVVVQDSAQFTKIYEPISKNDISRLKQGQQVRLSERWGSDQKWTGKISKVINNMDSPPEDQISREIEKKLFHLSMVSPQGAQWYYAIEIIAENKIPYDVQDNNFKVEIDYTTNTRVVPKSAVKQEGKKSYVLVAEDGKIIKTPVEIGLQTKEWVEIRKGITEEQNIVREVIVK